jgi:2-(1,2-epoxy-1,2-dihydrophenyl)acetyl-CoA isomerase
LSEDAVRLEFEGTVAIVTIDRPEAKNALTIPQIETLGNLIGDAIRQGARCLVVRGNRESFCAGRDLKETDPECDDTRALLENAIHPTLRAVRNAPIPTLALVHGPALGFGFGLALACDVTYVADDARLGSPFRNIGAILDSGGHWFLRERVGSHRAAELVFSGRLISGREAAAMGLVNASYGASDLHEVGMVAARSFASGPTAAFLSTKVILDTATDYEDTLRLEAIGQGAALAGPDGREGIRAFQEKRKPRFVGR